MWFHTEVIEPSFPQSLQILALPNVDPGFFLDITLFSLYFIIDITLVLMSSLSTKAVVVVSSLGPEFVVVN